MADEEEVVETDTAAEEDADAESEEESSEEDADSSSSKEEETDWEAVAAAEKIRADKATKKLATKRFKERQTAREESDEGDETEEEDDEEEKPITASQLETRLARDRQERLLDSQEATALEIARKNTTSEAEAKAAVLFWKGRVVPTGNLEEDMMFAIAGMNRKRIPGQQSEVRRAEKSRETASDDAASTHQDAPKAGEPKLSPQDAQVIKSSGFEWDGSKRMYKKPLGKSGKHLYYNPKATDARSKRFVA